jgi:hypothetical protein
MPGDTSTLLAWRFFGFRVSSSGRFESTFFTSQRATK